MINLVEAVLKIMQLLGAPPIENAIADYLGLAALLRFGPPETVAAYKILRDLLRAGSVACTGFCRGERRVVTPVELTDYYLDIGHGQLSTPPGRRAAGFPPITDILVNAADLAREFAKIAPKAKANGVAGCIAWLTQLRRTTGPQPFVRAELQAQAHKDFRVGPSQFRRAWDRAALAMPNEFWSRAGRPAAKIIVSK